MVRALPHGTCRAFVRQRRAHLVHLDCGGFRIKGRGFELGLWLPEARVCARVIAHLHHRILAPIGMVVRGHKIQVSVDPMRIIFGPRSRPLLYKGGWGCNRYSRRQRSGAACSYPQQKHAQGQSGQ